MGLANKAKLAIEEKKDTENILSDQEIDFILTKLRTADFKGTEFEMFYNIWVKLSSFKEK